MFPCPNLHLVFHSSTMEHLPLSSTTSAAIPVPTLLPLYQAGQTDISTAHPVSQWSSRVLWLVSPRQLFHPFLMDLGMIPMLEPRA